MPPEQQSPSSAYPTQPNASSFGPPPPPPPKKHAPWGLITPIILLFVLFSAAVIYAMQVASERDDYKNNVDEKIAVAVKDAQAKTETAKETEFLEREKNPYRAYDGPAAFGALHILYPKTWSAYITETDKGRVPVDGYFHPSFVPSTRSGTSFALHIEVVEKPYDDVVGDYESEAKKGAVRISPYAAPEVPSVLGVYISGEVEKGHQGATVLFPLRDKTIVLTTLSQQFIPDFNDIILKNLTFTP